MTTQRTCPFCRRIDSKDHEHVLGSAVGFPDAYPVADGHTLIVPTRHVARLGDLTEEEQWDLWALAIRMIGSVGAEVDGVNVGVNDGEAAGQTVPHVHLHLIPRKAGDVPEPRGGIRWVIPHKANYWEPPASSAF